jgi:hypothetical protein
MLYITFLSKNHNLPKLTNHTLFFFFFFFLKKKKQGLIQWLVGIIPSTLYDKIVVFSITLIQKIGSPNIVLKHS